MIRAVFVIPLLCWLLAARTPRSRKRVGVILAVIAAAEFAVSLGWVLPAGTITVMVLLVTLNVAVAVWGFVSDRAETAELSVLNRIGRTLVIGYCVLSVLCTALTVGVMKGQRASVPSNDALLPLPEGLTVLANTDRGCGGNSSTICMRAFEIGTAGTVPAEEVSDRVRSHLGWRHGWSLYHGRDGGWSGCRDEGWVFDRNNVCVSVFDRPGRTVVWFESVAYN
ncbi:hypothetical protein [Nocardia sp. bgisy134]|uniref:hypothetical protein n=1 Tax=Nocardia sp. bgisy134 TaxID=3413789 RepID=UPI003D75E86F